MLTVHLLGKTGGLSNKALILLIFYGFYVII